MTAVPDLPSTTGDPAAVAAGVHELLDACGGEVTSLAPEQFAATIAALSRARSRIHALELKLVAAAERSSVAAGAGCASTGSWLSQQTRSGTAPAARSVKLAVDLDDHLPATSAALAAGALSAEHASVIAHAASGLPKGLSQNQVATVEKTLVRKATWLDPGQLRRAARRALAAVEDEASVVDAYEDGLLRDEEQAAVDKTRLTLHDNGNGTLTGHFTVPLLAGSILKKVLETLTAPRRATGGRLGDRDWVHERGRAFADLLTHLPTDHLHGKVAATVVVTLDLETLRGQLKAAGLDTRDLVSAAEARRLACQAGIVPAVLGGESQPLDLGRSSRLFTEAQRVAGATRHTHCAAEGCQTPYAWCELHHRRPWSRGGPTDLADMVPLCGFHHRRIHHQDHLHRQLPDGSIRFSRRT